MDYKEIIEHIKKENGEVPKPIQALGNLDESLVINHIMDKKFVMSKQTIPGKYKALILLSAAIALDAQTCILNNTKLAKKNGATVEEIMETFALAKFSKAATTLSNSTPAFEWLLANK
ncbi:carboxymuconolactone decarboxylase family protein [Clostridium sp.]|uniref:carboxymuconolactone decarboxylase family protein n=1 Tax=Clostridium sp. TaxID=1506 RepID=UPI001A3A7075|nr:carboxymuconolactone decarboxylase family protein [Clostridium sp.]MBK5241091.1 carboxymuconolactone decarboxylase family protein [Clostridium sp.]